MPKPTLKFLFVLMTTALGFGFLHLFFPEDTPWNFERLHVFLFNLCSGGTLILLHSRKNRPIPLSIRLFPAIGILFALSAFFEIYAPAMILAVVMSGIVEKERIERFSLFPAQFFDPKEPVANKFHQASLLCLSMGLLISSLVMLNETALHLITMEKLTLDTFFLGFSFPVSLITMSVMFRLIGDNRIRITRVLKNVGFWGVNLGVILFFGFILFEQMMAQLVISVILFLVVLLIFALFVNSAYKAQQKAFLTSGMCFLVFTGITGIAYILLEMSPLYTEGRALFLLKLHSYASLYGWNLSGLAVIVRYRDFPIRLHSRTLIATHWTVVLLLAPVGYYLQPFAAVTMLGYAMLLVAILFTAPENRELETILSRKPVAEQLPLPPEA